MPEAYDVISVADTCVFEELPFEPTAADFKAKLTQLYTGLSADCKVRATCVAQVSSTHCPRYRLPACMILAVSETQHVDAADHIETDSHECGTSFIVAAVHSRCSLIAVRSLA